MHGENGSRAMQYCSLYTPRMEADHSQLRNIRTGLSMNIIVQRLCVVGEGRAF